MSVVDQLIGGLNYWLMTIFNLPGRGLVILSERLMSANVDISSLKGMWQFTAYIVSFFYLVLLVYAGFKLMVSGGSAEERAKSKKMLTDTVIMIIMVQLSYWLYSLAVSLSAGLSAAVFRQIPSSFFSLRMDFVNLFTMPVYLLVLLSTVILLTVRYIIVAFGVCAVPIAFCFYYFEPLKQYGRFILNVLFAFVFVPFFQALIILTASMLDSNYFMLHGVLLISSFVLADLVMVFVTLFVIVKSAIGVMKSDVVRVVSLVKN